MKCLILAAGYATRLYPLTENFPKPLLEVQGKTILDWLLEDIDKANMVFGIKQNLTVALAVYYHKMIPKFPQHRNIHCILINVAHVSPIGIYFARYNNIIFTVDSVIGKIVL